MTARRGPVPWRVAAADLLLGAACAVCGRPALHVCAACAPQLVPRVERVHVRPTVVAAGRYDGAWSAVVPAWKERRHAGLLPWLSVALASAVLEVAGEGSASGPVLLVPVPTSRRNRRRRGVDHMAVLARSSADVLRRCGVSAEALPLVRLARQTRDQADLGALEREANVRGAFAARRSARRGVIVVVDDVTTTGATVHAVLHALASAGHVPSGAATVAWRP